ncbi:hypothetical protein GCM10022227_48630 [Streptomyces sedi]
MRVTVSGVLPCTAKRTPAKPSGRPAPAAPRAVRVAHRATAAVLSPTPAANTVLAATAAVIRRRMTPAWERAGERATWRPPFGRRAPPGRGEPRALRGGAAEPGGEPTAPRRVADSGR